MENEEKITENSSCEACSCPYCDNTAAMAYPFCTSCGKEFNFCPHCNEPVRHDVKTCPHCGKKIEKSD